MSTETPIWTQVKPTRKDIGFYFWARTNLLDETGLYLGVIERKPLTEDRLILRTICWQTYDVDSDYILFWQKINYPDEPYIEIG